MNSLEEWRTGDFGMTEQWEFSLKLLLELLVEWVGRGVHVNLIQSLLGMTWTLFGEKKIGADLKPDQSSSSCYNYSQGPEVKVHTANLAVFLHS